VKCKNCRATVPLLKTRWLCKKDKKRVVLEMTPRADKSGVDFRVNTNPPTANGNKAQQTALDKKLGAGTMSRSGAQCPCCNAIMTMEDIRVEGKAGRLGAVMTAVVVDGMDGKEYRLPQPLETAKSEEARAKLSAIYAEIPFGLPIEPTPIGGNGATRAFSVHGYGLNEWQKLFNSRQLLALGTIVRIIRTLSVPLERNYSHDVWREAIVAYVTCGLQRYLDFANTAVQWKIDVSTINHSLVRFALPIVWDYAEGNAIGDLAGSYQLCYQRIVIGLDTFSNWNVGPIAPNVLNQSALLSNPVLYDVIVTDPPYYDAIPYSDLMDFFYVWLRRALHGQINTLPPSFELPLGPKWDASRSDGELIDDSSRHGNDKSKSKDAYEEGMYQAFSNCEKSLSDVGRLVIVFAHKTPDAWETLAAAIIRAGFVVDGSWPIQTEQASRMRAISSSALASSLWLVCKKRTRTARPGWDGPVLEDMRQRITERLRYFWDAGIRGPDFVWAATGPALEAYSKHPVVRKADKPGATMSVSEFLQHVRRMVVDFAVGRILTYGEGGAEVVTGLDDVTIYYLLHRNDFGLGEAPSGACIMYALSCGLSDKALADQFGILQMKDSPPDSGGLLDGVEGEDEEEVGEDDEPTGDGVSSGGKCKLVPWNKRMKKTLGLAAPGGKPVPLIDQVHRLMHLWKAGDVVKVNEYLDERALRNNKLFQQLLQALIELAERGSQERSLLESISNHVRARGEKHDDRQSTFEVTP
jgi:adenine-specific DNA methylase